MRVLSDGRVRRTRAEWQAILNRFRKSDLSVAEFCKREKISSHVFGDWSRKLDVKVERKPRFVEVTPPPTSKPASPAAPREFELSLPGDVVLRWKA